MHTVDFDQIGKPLVTPILFHHKTRDHTGYGSAGCQRSIRYGAHQARIAGPVDHPQVPFAQQTSQLGRSLRYAEATCVLEAQYTQTEVILFLSLSIFLFAL